MSHIKLNQFPVTTCKGQLHSFAREGQAGGHWEKSFLYWHRLRADFYILLLLLLIMSWQVSTDIKIHRQITRAADIFGLLGVSQTSSQVPSWHCFIAQGMSHYSQVLYPDSTSDATPGTVALQTVRRYCHILQCRLIGESGLKRSRALLRFSTEGPVVNVKMWLPLWWFDYLPSFACQMTLKLPAIKVVKADTFDLLQTLESCQHVLSTVTTMAFCLSHVRVHSFLL